MNPHIVESFKHGGQGIVQIIIMGYMFDFDEFVGLKDRENAKHFESLEECNHPHGPQFSRMDMVCAFNLLLGIITE